MIVNIPVSVAELFDKISILEIKKNEIKNPEQLFHVEKELKELLLILDEVNIKSFLDNDLYHELKTVNKEIWKICELRRDFEFAEKFDTEFIWQSRCEYKSNDRRALVKKNINKFFDSELIEVKSYQRLTCE